MHAERERARALVLAHGWNAACYQVLTPGMSLWFSSAGDAVAGYARYRDILVVAGAPVCDATRLPSVVEELERDAARQGHRTLYFAAGHRLESMMGARARVPIGALPTWDPMAWSKGLAAHAALRAQLNRARNKGVVVEEVRCHPAEIRRIRPVLDAWLAARALPPLGFMTSAAVLDYPGDRRLFVATHPGLGTIAYLVAAPVPARGGWLVEQWPRRPDAPNGTTHLMIDAAMRAFARAGSGFATLGLAPLAERGAVPGRPTPVWINWLFRWMRAHGRRFYNFQGLEAFKASLAPATWEPVYVVGPGRELTPAMLVAIAGAFANGAPVRLMVRAGAQAIASESARLRGGRLGTATYM